MNNRKFLLLVMLIAPWLTVPFLGRTDIKRFLPSGLFITIFTKILDLYGEKQKWWRFYKGIPPFDSMNFLNFGPFFVSSLWMLKFTYGKFLLYMISNFILHVGFIYIALKYLKKFRILRLVNLPKLHYLGVHTLRGLTLYAFQVLKDKLTAKRKQKQQRKKRPIQIADPQ